MIQSQLETIERPDSAIQDSGLGDRYGVLIYNNDFTPIDRVVSILIYATQCPIDEAVIETLEAHEIGRAWVHFSTEPECQRIAAIIAQIGVKTEVRKEWED